MEGRAAICRKDAQGRDDAGAERFRALDLSVPVAGILAICANVLRDRKPFVRAVPADHGVFAKVGRQSLFVLRQNVAPEFISITSR